MKSRREIACQAKQSLLEVYSDEEKNQISTNNNSNNHNNSNKVELSPVKWSNAAIAAASSNKEVRQDTLINGWQELSPNPLHLFKSSSPSKTENASRGGSSNKKQSIQSNSFALAFKDLNEEASSEVANSFDPTKYNGFSQRSRVRSFRSCQGKTINIAGLQPNAQDNNNNNGTTPESLRRKRNGQISKNNQSPFSFLSNFDAAYPKDSSENNSNNNFLFNNEKSFDPYTDLFSNGSNEEDPQNSLLLHKRNRFQQQQTASTSGTPSYLQKRFEHSAQSSRNSDTQYSTERTTQSQMRRNRQTQNSFHQQQQNHSETARAVKSFEYPQLFPFSEDRQLSIISKLDSFRDHLVKNSSKDTQLVFPIIQDPFSTTPRKEDMARITLSNIGRNIKRKDVFNQLKTAQTVPIYQIIKRNN